MILKWFISHQIKEATRSSFWQKQVVLNIIMGTFLLIMLAYLVMFGFFIDKILESIFPDDNPVVLINGIVLYYFCIEILIRFFIQSLPCSISKPIWHFRSQSQPLFTTWLPSRSFLLATGYRAWFSSRSP